VFRKMRENGRPPDDWKQLLAKARAEGQRLRQFAAGIAR
jgi:toxin YhaV